MQAKNTARTLATTSQSLTGEAEAQKLSSSVSRKRRRCLEIFLDIFALLKRPTSRRGKEKGESLEAGWGNCFKSHSAVLAQPLATLQDKGH